MWWCTEAAVEESLWRRMDDPFYIVEKGLIILFSEFEVVS